MSEQLISFVTLDEYKQVEGINSPNSDVKLSYIIDGVNSLLRTFLEYPDDLVYEEIYNKDTQVFRIESEYIFKDVRLQDSIPLAINGRQLTDGEIQSSGKGYVVLDFGETGTVSLLPFIVIKPGVPPYQNPAATPAAIKMAAYNLVTHYYKDQYRASVGSGTQSVSYTPSTNNIPRHVIAMLAPFRPL